jgi:CheY-like chemotaxis protein
VILKQRILIVDDDEGLVYILKDLLIRKGYEVVAAAFVSQAIKAVENELFDLLIVDLKMPDMDGWHFVMKVRHDPRYQKVPIIVLSALLKKDSAPDEFDQVDAYMVKPFEVQKLVEKIKELLLE